MRPADRGDQRVGLRSSARAAVALCWRASPGCAGLRIGLTLAAAGLPPAVAWCSKLLVDELTRGPAGSLSRVTLLALVCALLGAAALLISELTTYVEARHNAAITLLAESDLFRRVCEFVGLRYFEDPRFQDRLLMAEQSAGDGPSSLTSGAQTMGRSAASLVGYLAMIAVIWPLLAILLVVAAVPNLVAEIRLANQQVAASLRVSSLDRRRYFYRMLLGDVRAAKEVRLYRLGGVFRRRQLDALRESQDVMVRLAGRSAIIQSSLSLVGAAIAGLAVVVVARRVVAGELTPGDVVLFVAAVAGVQGALVSIVGEIGRLSQSLKLFQRYLDVMRAPIDLPVRNQSVPPLRQELRFENVWFRYDESGPWILRGVTFVLNAGTSLGVVGVNGAGKSTLVKLACRFYDPDRGRILWDGTDLRAFDPASLRARMAVTFQDFMTYDLTAEENIGVGDVERLTDAGAVRSAAERAGVADVICRLPRGYDTLLSRIFVTEVDEERGVTLSGGQWQRIALARSLMRDDADLLILDEPSSNLDAEAEYKIHQALRELRQGRTSLLISHRLGSVREADHIIVVDDGEIVEQGDHDHLMARSGVYARLFTIQARGYRREDTPLDAGRR